MAEPVDSLDTDRSNRVAALATLKSHVERFREKPVKERVSNDLARKARDVAQEAADVAADSKPVIAGTLGALAIWFLRKPLLAGARRAWPLLKDRISKDKTP